MDGCRPARAADRPTDPENCGRGETERPVSSKQRDKKRFPDFRSVELVTSDPGGGERAYPLILRDSSGAGLGGLYVGKDPLDPEADFVLREPGGGDRRIRIVWARKVADYVQLVGMMVAEG